MTTYDRPVNATLVVRLDNGEEWEATFEDVAKFKASTMPVDTALTPEERLRSLQKRMNDDLNIWGAAHDAVRDENLPGGDAIFLEFPIKTPYYEIYDHLGAIADHIRDQS